MPAIAAIPHQTHTPQLTPITVSRAFQPEVRGAPQIKGHTRRSLGPNPLTQIRGEEKSENDTFLRHNVGSKGSSSGVHIVYFCLFWCFLFDLMLFQRWLFSALQRLKPIFWAWAVSDCLCHGCFVLHRASSSSVKAEGGGCIKARVRWTQHQWIKFFCMIK